MAVAAAPKGGYQVGGWYWDASAGNARQYTGSGFGDPGKVALNGNNNGGGGNSNPGVSNEDIDKAFGPTTDALNGMKSDFTNLDTQQQGHINDTYNAQKALIPGYQSSMANTEQQGENTYNQAHKSAYEQSLDKYNALSQRNMALYGGSNSAGEAGNELLGRAFQQGQDALQGQDASAQLQFQGQKQDITNWVANTSTQLDTWKRQAEDTLQAQFIQGIGQINLMQGQTETAKAQAKLGLVNQIQQNKIALDNLHTQLTNQLTVAQAMQMNPMDQSAFTQNTLNLAGQTANIATQPYSSVAPQVQAPRVAATPWVGNMSTNYKDPFSVTG